MKSGVSYSQGLIIQLDTGLVTGLFETSPGVNFQGVITAQFEASKLHKILKLISNVIPEKEIWRVGQEE